MYRSERSTPSPASSCRKHASKVSVWSSAGADAAAADLARDGDEVAPAWAASPLSSSPAGLAHGGDALSGHPALQLQLGVGHAKADDGLEGTRSHGLRQLEALLLRLLRPRAKLGIENHDLAARGLADLGTGAPALHGLHLPVEEVLAVVQVLAEEGGVHNVVLDALAVDVGHLGAALQKVVATLAGGLGLLLPRGRAGARDPLLLPVVAVEGGVRNGNLVHVALHRLDDATRGRAGAAGLRGVLVGGDDLGLLSEVAQHRLGDALVLHLGGGVPHDENEVETGYQRALEAELLGHVHVLTPAAVEGVGGGKDGAASVERGVDAGLGNRHGLLLHHFVDGNTVVGLHLVEFVNADHATVAHDHGAALHAALASVLVSDHGGGEADAGGPAAGGGHGAREQVHHETQHLRFAATGIAHQQNVNVAPDAVVAALVALRSADEGEEEPALHELVAADGGSH
ncbi:YfcC family protein [Babesia caballi]|uniref:YfcC family protein n=1 Tax=Babesia caballi TaxID=5871 RepID=A0AAV4LZQ9_BABCB|nr:YfcC family protein [Babesia caballi]